MKYLTYLEKKQQLEALARDVQSLKDDPEVRETQVFLDRLEGLMDDYGMTAAQVRDILFPPPPAQPAVAPLKGTMAVSAAGKAPKIHAQREPSVYRNPYTGEVLRTLDPRNAKLKEWREQYGMNEVVNWKEP